MRSVWVYVFTLMLVLGADALYAQKDNIKDLRGVVWEDDLYNDLPLKINYGQLSAPIPMAFSLKPYVPRVVTQGPFNTSASWATVWYAGTILKNRSFKEQKVSDNETIAPFYSHYVTKNSGDKNCKEPVSLVSILKQFNEKGAPTFGEFRDFCANSAEESVIEAAKKNRITAFAKLFNTNDSKDVKVYTIKQAIASGNPVVVAMDVPKSFNRAAEFWAPKEKSSAGISGHALTVVGYDDRKYGGAFEVVNSWGKSWGIDGFTWIRYADFPIFLRYGFEVFRDPYYESGENAIDGRVQFVDEARESYEVENLSDNHYRLKGKIATGSKMRILVSSVEPAFLYFIVVTPDKSVYFLYPDEDRDYLPIISQSAGQVFLPSPSEYFELEEPVGINHFIFAFSREELPSNVLEKLKNSSGEDPLSEIEETLKSIAAPLSLSTFEGEQITFSTKNAQKILQYILVDVEQK